jgi:2-polyprenyl-6-methoxyphenol hydroxylase-like FAD-dependent oxidoreductase
VTAPPAVPVVIAGGGPAGLACAIELGRRRIDCLVVEPRREVAWQRPRAKTTSIRSMEHFRRWGIADRIREAAPLPVAWSDEAVFCTTLLGQEITRIDDCFGLAAERRDEFAEAGQQIPQPFVEQVLRDAARDLDTVTLRTGSRLTGLTERSDRVELQLTDDGDERSSLSAEYVLGCEGSRSVARAAIGSVYEGSAHDLPNFNVVFRSHGLAERVPHGPAVHYWIVNPDTAGLLGRMDLADTWWAIAIGVSEATGARSPERLVHALVGAPLDVEVLATDPWIAKMLLADRYQSERVALVGDAAHLNPPWGGHGFNTAIGDAANIGWKLAARLDGWGGPALLASYETERRPIARETIAEAEANMRVPPSYFAQPGLTAPGLEGDRARRLVAERIQIKKAGEFRSLGLVLGYTYDGSPIIAAEPELAPAFDPSRYVPSARAGARLPHGWLRDGRSLYDILGDGFTLLRTRSEADPGPFASAAQRRGLPLAVVDVHEPELANRLGAPLVLVRPDQHIAWRGTAEAAEAGSILDLVRGA